MTEYQLQAMSRTGETGEVIFRNAAPGSGGRPDPANCTAMVRCNGGRITTESCTTRRPLIDDGGSSDGERDYYICPDCRKSITVDYREN